MKILLPLPLLVVLCGDATAGPRPVPVMLGVHGNPELDACLSTGAVLRDIEVRAAPSAKAKVVLNLVGGREVYLCGSSEDGQWEGIVVPPNPGFDCGVSGGWGPGSTPYVGPCESGWVPEGGVGVVAG